MIAPTMQYRREIAATAKALETLATDMAEAGGAGDFDYVAIHAFRASLAVLSLRGQADRLAVATAEQHRLQGIVVRAAHACHPTLVARGPAALLEAFSFWFPTARLEDLNLDRVTALRWFVAGIVELER